MTTYHLPPEELKQAADISVYAIETQKLFWLCLENEWFVGYFYDSYGGLNYCAASVDDMPESIKGKGMGSASTLTGYTDLIAPDSISPTLDKALEALESVQWIDVNDRLPEMKETDVDNWQESKECLIMVKGKGKEIGQFNGNIYDDGDGLYEEWYSTTYDDIILNVTHWMPLPDTAKITEAINELKKLKG